MDVKSTLRKYISEEMLHDAGASALTEDTPLIEGGIIDSMNLIRLVAFIEERLGVTVAAEELDIDNFRTISAIESYVKRKSGSS